MPHDEENDIGSVEDVVIYRLQTANEFIKAARLLMNSGFPKTAANRVYYSIFKSLSALHELDGNSYRKHRAVLDCFNKDYVHAGIFPEEYGAKVYRVQKLRHTSDYEDFKTPTRSELTEHIRFATDLLLDVKPWKSRKVRRGKTFLESA